MITYTIYQESSGEIFATGVAQQQNDVFNMTSNGQAYLLIGSKEFQYVENGSVVDMPPKPYGEYTFDYDSKAWVFNESAARAKALYQRDQLLKDGPDRINPLWWSAMTPEQQQAWSAYRQDLLDITSQPSFPMEISWPTKPV